MEETAQTPATLTRQTVLPAEWAPQSAVLLTWPHPYGDWRPCLEQADRNFAELAVAITRHQRLVIACRDDAHRRYVQDLLDGFGVERQQRRLYLASSNDSWARDHGPITVYRDGRPVLLNFHFNGWGRKFAFDLDNGITEKLHAAGAFGDTLMQSVDLVLEGGSIESDGEGVLLTTSQCLLAGNRNELSQGELERRLRVELGVERILWLEQGYLVGDDTDGHIDTLARFCDPETIAYQSCEDPGDEHFLPLGAMAEQLRSFRTIAGKPYRLIPLPLPQAIIDPDSQRQLPAGYANFLILNGAVLVPVYDDPADGIALEKLQAVFPGREVVGIDCRTLIRQYGSLHCVTMQLPAGVLVN